MGGQEKLRVVKNYDSNAVPELADEMGSASIGVKPKRQTLVLESDSDEMDDDTESDDSDDEEKDRALQRAFEQLKLAKKAREEKKAKKKAAKCLLAGWTRVEGLGVSAGGVPAREVDNSKTSNFTCPYGCMTPGGGGAKSFRSQGTWIAHLMDKHNSGAMAVRIVIETPPNLITGSAGTRHVMQKLPADGV